MKLIIIEEDRRGVTNKRLLLILLLFFFGGAVAIMLAVEPVVAQEPHEQGESQSPEPEPLTTPALEFTGTGWGAQPLPAAADISILALNPVDCAVMNPPVIGYEISRGQDPDDMVDFFNDLTASGFSLGTVNITAGPIPSCVDILIVSGLARNMSLSSAYSAADGAMLRTWAAGGRGLMLLGDWGPFRVPIEALFQAYGYSQQGAAAAVSDPTDFDPAGPTGVFAIYQTDNFANHPILSGVASLELLASSWLSPTTNAIITTDADAVPPGAAVMAAFTDGNGCVALTTDSNWLGVFDSGYFKQQNARVGRQMIDWLAGCTTLDLSKVAVPSPVQAGGLLTYTLTVSNNSAITLTNLLITDTVPAGATFVNATLPFAGPDAGGVITWSLGALNPNTSAGVTMVVQVDSLAPLGAVITNTAWVTSTQGLSATATTSTPVEAQIIVDPVVTLAVDRNLAQVGEAVTFTVTVQQSAPSNGNATNVQVVDPLPNEVDILGVTVNAGFTTLAGQVISWTMPILAPGDIRQMTIQARVNSPNPPPFTIRNQATLRFDQGPDRLSNLVEIFVLVPAPAPQPTLPPQGDDDDKDDDDDNRPKPATPPPVAATAMAAAAPMTTPILPVAFLPDTGEATPRQFKLGFIILLVMGVLGVLLKRNLRLGRENNKEDFKYEKRI